MAELCRLATHCKFGDKLSEALRDRFVCGLRDSAIQKRLLTQKNLDLNTALETALGMEAAEAGAKRLQNTHNTEPMSVGRLTHPHPKKGLDDKGKTGKQKQCYRCGSSSHLASSCKFLKSQCFQCGRTGHLKKMCRSKAAADRPTVRQVDEASDYVSHLNALNSPTLGRSPPIQVSIELDGCTVSMGVDTGAAYSLVSSSTFD